MMTLREKYIQKCFDDYEEPYNLNTEKAVRIAVHECFHNVLTKFNWKRADEKDLLKNGCDVNDYVEINMKLWNVIYNLAMQELKYFTDLDISRLEYTPVMTMLVEEKVIYNFKFTDTLNNDDNVCLFADGPVPHPTKAEEKDDDKVPENPSKAEEKDDNKASENPTNCNRMVVIHSLIDDPENLPTRLVDGDDESDEVLIEVINKKTNRISQILSRYNYKLENWDYVYPDYEVLWWMNVPKCLDLLK